MDAATVFRVMSLIPDRQPRTQSGSAFQASGNSERVQLLARFLGWLGPLSPTTKEEQQLLGVRSSAPRPLEGEEPAEEAAEQAAEEADLDLLDDLEETPVRLPGAGTQIAA
jgi:hypothetical protein